MALFSGVVSKRHVGSWIDFGDIRVSEPELGRQAEFCCWGRHRKRRCGEDGASSGGKEFVKHVVA